MAKYGAENGDVTGYIGQNMAERSHWNHDGTGLPRRIFVAI
jgi:hypothetical protein